MIKEYKLRFIKEFNKEVSAIYTTCLKQICSNSHAKIQSRAKLVEFFSDRGSEYAKKLDWMLHMNILQMYQTKHCFYFFGFRFPSSFSSYEELVRKTQIRVSSELIYDHREQSTSKSWYLTELQTIRADLEYLGSIYDRTNATQQNMRTPSSIAHELFSYALLDDGKCHLLCNVMRDNNEDVENAVSALEVFLRDRSELNRLKKNKKQVKNNLKQHPQVIENEVKIRDLEAQIRKLKQQNRELMSVESHRCPIELAQEKANKSSTAFMATSEALVKVTGIRELMRKKQTRDVLATIFDRF